VSWLERLQRKISDTQGRELTELTKAPSVSFVSTSGVVSEIFSAEVEDLRAAQADDGIIWAETERKEAVQSCESRRKRVLAMLTNDPNLERAYLVEPDAYPSAASVFIADRDKSFEVLIPRRWFDPFAVAELVRTWVR
jgi:hypothetical protein